MKYKTFEPYPHQIDAMNKAYLSQSFALLWEMGTEKTFGMINILRLKYGQSKRVQRTLILTPLITLYNWKEEFKMHSYVEPSDITVLDCNGAKRNKMFSKAAFSHNGEQKDAVIIMNYEALQTDSLFSLIEDWAPEIVVADEIHLIKNHKAKRAKRAVVIADRANFKFGLTGTPILNKPTDIFMQYRFLDPSIFGKNYFAFQAKYMKDENAGWSSRPGYFPKYVARPEMFGELQDKIYSIATRVTKKDCIKDLPPLIKTVKHIPLSKEQQRMYDQMKKEFITFVKDQQEEGKSKAVVAQLAITKALRLQQIVTGFVKTDEDEIVAIKDNPRLKVVEDLLEQLIHDHKVILWCSFKHNYKQLGELCTKMKIKHSFITGDMTLKEKQESMNEFRNNEENRVIIANRQCRS